MPEVQKAFPRTCKTFIHHDFLVTSKVIWLRNSSKAAMRQSVQLIAVQFGADPA
jgi:hypothetical protein